VEQDTTPQRNAASQAGLLFAAAGILTILNNFVPGSEYLDKAFLHVVGLACLALGAVVPRLPWPRWPVRATLAICPLAFAVIAVANQRGGVSTYSYAPFFIIVFMWVGLHHPPRTSFALAPLATIAYMVPGLMASNPPDGALSSVTVAIPVCVLVAETIARTVGRVRRAEQDIQHSYELLHRSQALANVGSWEWDVETGAVEWSPEMFRILGVPEGEFETAFEPVLNLVVPEDREAVSAQFRSAAKGDAVPGFAFRIKRPDGSRRWLWCEGGPASDRAGIVTGFVQDVTEPKQVEEELARLALKDDLTGLANRRAFVTVGEQLLRVAQRAGETAMLVYIDLDNMKDVNDTHGHAAGDQALVEVADLLRATFREADLVARLGGDEFAVFVPRQGTEAEAGVDRLRDAVEARAGRFPPIALSIGMSTYEGDGPCSIEDLIERADAAMYAEKALRRLQD
jgi:diguanylate cyclase (GGDEF)-like protein/PAS domain S-box-containing protein